MMQNKVPYRGKFSLGANFRDFRGQTYFRENKNRKKYPLRRKLMTSYVRTSIRIYLCERDGSLQSVCLLNGCCKEKEACYYTEYHRIPQNTSKFVRRSEVFEFEISSESNAPVSHPRRQYWYLRNCESLQTKERLGHCCTGLLLRFVVQCRFAYGAWPSTGRGVARASRIC